MERGRSERDYRAPRSEPMVTFEVTMTPAEYETIRKDASWYGKSVAVHLVDHALGRTPRGC